MRKRKKHPSAYVFVGTYGHVMALDRGNGRKVWTTSLPRTGFSAVSIVYEEGQLICGSGGRVFALDPATGEILWKNGLQGMGTGLVFLTTGHSNNYEAVMTLLAEQEAQDEAASRGGDGVV